MATATAVHTGARPQAAPTTALPVYFISDRPEAYEIWGEVSREEALSIAALIAARAAQRFPDIEFRIDGSWHTHPATMGHVAEYIEGNWQSWLTDARPAS